MKDLMLARSPLSGCVYAFRQYREETPGVIVATGKREDVTARFRAVMNEVLQEFIEDGTLQVADEQAANRLNEFFGLGEKTDV